MMIMLPVSSSVFDEHLIQRSSSGDTDDSSNYSEVATPQDESVPVLGAVVDLEHATKDMRSMVERRSSVSNGKEYQPLYRELPTLGGLDTGESPSTMLIASASDFSVSESSEFEILEDTCAKVKGMFNMPNKHISIEAREHEDEGVADGLEIGGSIKHSIGLGPIFNETRTIGKLGKSALRVLFFVPWSMAVGAGIILCPKKLDTITFHAGYLEPLAGVRGFRHWMNRWFEYLFMFSGFLGLVAWLWPFVGVFLACGMGAVGVYAWRDFGGMLDYVFILE